MMIQADEELLERARREAARRGVSISQVVRDALEGELAAPSPQPELRCIGAFRSGHPRGAGTDAYQPPPFRS